MFATRRHQVNCIAPVLALDLEVLYLPGFLSHSGNNRDSWRPQPRTSSAASDTSTIAWQPAGGGVSSGALKVRWCTPLASRTYPPCAPTALVCQAVMLAQARLQVSWPMVLGM